MRSRNFSSAIPGVIAFLAAVLITGCASERHDNGQVNTSFGASGGLEMGMGTLPLLTEARTRSISAENPTGEKGKGGMAIPNPAEPKPAASARAADDLGQGWKVRPFLRVNAGETVTLMDVDGPGIIQHIWMVEGLSRAHVLRVYWDEGLFLRQLWFPAGVQLGLCRHSPAQQRCRDTRLLEPVPLAHSRSDLLREGRARDHSSPGLGLGRQVQTALRRHRLGRLLVSA